MKFDYILDNNSTNGIKLFCKKEKLKENYNNEIEGCLKQFMDFFVGKTWWHFSWNWGSPLPVW